ncbi:hypothetical protein D3C86_2239940 [compost metagenome]
MIVELINPPFAKAKRCGGQPKQTHLGVHLFQVVEDLLILALVVIADAMALIDNQ